MYYSHYFNRESFPTTFFPLVPTNKSNHGLCLTPETVTLDVVHFCLCRGVGLEGETPSTPVEETTRRSNRVDSFLRFLSGAPGRVPGDGVTHRRDRHSVFLDQIMFTRSPVFYK